MALLLAKKPSLLQSIHVFPQEALTPPLTLPCEHVRMAQPR